MGGPTKERSVRLAPADGTEVAALVARAKRGDRQAFDRLVALHTAQVYNLSLRITGSREDAEDCVQEAFVRAFRRLHSFRGEAAFSTWLYRVALNVAADTARKRARAPLAASALAAGDPDEPAPDLAEIEARAEVAVPGPEKLLEAQARRQAVLQAVRRLPEHHRTVVVLYDLQGLSYQEIARITGTRVGTIKSRLNRARLALKELLLPHWELLRE